MMLQSSHDRADHTRSHHRFSHVPCNSWSGYGGSKHVYGLWRTDPILCWRGPIQWWHIYICTFYPWVQQSPHFNWPSYPVYYWARRRRIATLPGYNGHPQARRYTQDLGVQETHTYGPVPQLGCQLPSETQEVSCKNPVEKRWQTCLRSIWQRWSGTEGKWLHTMGPHHHPRQMLTQLHHHPAVWHPLTLSLYTLWSRGVRETTIVQRVLNKVHGTSSYYKLINTLRAVLVNPEDNTEKFKQCGVVYSLS